MRLTQTATTTNPHDCRWAPTFMFATFLEEQRWARSKYSELSTHLLPLALWYGLRPFPFGGIPPFTHTHTSPPPPPPPLSQQLCFLFDLLMFSWKAETLQTETRLRAERDSHTSSYLFFFSFFFSCHLIDLITWSILLNNVSHLVPLFWDLSISCLLRDLRGEALFAFNERGRSSQNIHYSIGGMNYGTGLQRASYRKHLIRLSNIYHQMHVWPRSQWRPL